MVERTPTTGAADQSLQRLLAARTGRSSVSLRRLGRTEGPLSPSQERLWLLDQLAPAGVYNVPAAFRLCGPLDVPRLRTALKTIAARHDVLRTAVEAVAGVPRQYVRDIAGPVLSCVDLSGYDDPAGLARVAAGAAVRQPMDLSAGPLWKAVLYRLAPDDHVLLIVLHHLAGDATSFAIVAHELGVLYDGGPDSLPPLPVQYLDVAWWQRERLDDDQRHRLGTWWRAELADAPHLLAWPTEAQRPDEPRGRGRLMRVSVPHAVADGVAGLARAEGTTTFIVYLSIFGILLSRYCRQPHLLIGVPSSGRTQDETRSLVGCFLNMLVLRLDLRDPPTVRALIRQVHRRAAGAYSHAELPFEELVKQLQPLRSPRHTPLFQAVFSVHDAGSELPQLAGVRPELFDIDNEAAVYDLSVDIERDAERQSALWSYDDDLLDEVTVRTLAAGFTELASRCLERPDARVDRLPLLVASGRSVAGPEMTHPATIIDVLGQLIDTHRERIAVRCGNQQLTYAELGRRAATLAAWLRERGVREETVVGVQLPRSVDLVVALLAVWWAGGAYLPIDPEQPDQRRVTILTDAQAVTVITAEDVVATRDPVSRPPVRPRGESLAYVIYTSGSTGTPKGVEVTHAALANLLFGVRAMLPAGDSPVLLAVSTVAFDIAALELFLPLTSGGSVVLATEAATRDGRQLRDMLRAHGVTMMQGTPATWRLVTDEGPLPSGTNLVALVGGEAVPAPLARKLAEQVGLWNMYGPTETTIWSLTHHVDPAEQVVPIGRPLPNTTVYLLDDHGQPVPDGFTGEVYIGGTGVARGYRARPGLTADRFRPDPYAGRAGARMYRTGDLARMLPGGALLFLGRTDDQLKIRGFRIEPGEVEHALLTHGGVREAAVTSWDAPSGRMLVGYVAGPADSLVALRERLHTVLPPYLVPDLLVPLPALPRNHAGKIDRHALPPPDPRVDDDSKPAEGGETLVAEVWQSLLGLSRIGASTSFFQLGGHSLTVAELRFRLGETFGVDIPLVDLMTHVTVRDQAALVEELLIEQVMALSDDEVAAAMEDRPGERGGSSGSG